MAFQKGNRANPGGRPKEKLFTDALRLAVNRDGDDGKKKLHDIANKLVDCAVAGESWAIQQVADRLDGKPAQESTLNVNRMSASELPDDELADIAAGGGEDTAGSPIDPAQLN